ncbi:hypothetical protein R6Q59_015499 [Mikania micrantha]
MSFMKDFDHLKIQMKDIVTATNNFDPTSVIGCGGFGRVYRGELSLANGPITVAFKKLDRRLGQGNVEFWKEIMMLSRYKHENLISLMHYAIEGDEMILVYEYASRGSLDRYLTNARTLAWTQRLKICVGVARGLHFLHDPKSTQQRVLHRDIKSANILLDENWTAKVSDFGLSKLSHANQAHSYLISHAVGTPGYCDPLYWELGFLSKESDVLSFGVVLYEILCGRLCYEQRNHELTKILVPKWRRSYDEKRLDEIILPGLKAQMDPGSMETFSAIAYRCVKKAREDRPIVAEIVEKLEFSLVQQKIFEDAHKNSSRDRASILFNGQADQSLDIVHQHNEADDDDNLPKDKENEYMQSSDSYSSKGKKKSGDKATQQDHYALLGLDHLRSSFEKKEKPWGKEEIELLRKGIVKYPKGTSRRWEVISEYVGTGRSVEEILKVTKTVLLQKPDSAKAFDSFLEKRKPSVNISSPLTTREEVVGASSTVTPTPTQPDVVPPKLSQDANKVELVGSSSDQDVWSAVQETALVQALKTFPKETNARWDRVAAAVPGKSVVQCKKQFALLKEKFRNKKK